MADAPLAKVVDEIVARLREPLNLDRWTIKVEFGPGESTGACSAMPEYRSALLSIDPDRLQTGDELDEILCHELLHTATWPISSVADDLAIALAEVMPEPFVAPMGKLHKETVRKAEEKTTTAVGHIVVKILRRLWQAEAELAATRKEVTALRRQVRETAA